MLFNTYAFILLFLPVSLLGWFLWGRYAGLRMAQAWLVWCSLFYYGWWNPKYLALIGGSMLLNYALGSLIFTRREREKSAGDILALGVTLNLLTLGYFKYANFFTANINAFLQTGWVLDNVILPLAISFFTFQQIAYLVDATRGEIRRNGFLTYALFVCFFPQLIAGPIVHHKEMMPQFARQEVLRVNWLNLAVGLTLFTIGLAKKVLLADPLSERVAMYFGAADAGMLVPGTGAWYGVLAYSLQIYFDFSGYTDMALGLAKMFNITLPQNFNSPYQANNIIEFWRRWHMTLSRFLRDYVYIPLGGNRRGKIRRHVNLMATMLLGGLWHGASWTFVIWGGIHGLYLILDHMWLGAKGRLWILGLLPGWLRVATARLLTLVAVTAAWVYFRAESMEGAIQLFESMLGFTPETLTTASPLTVPKPERWLWLGALWAIALFAPNSQDILSRYRPSIGRDTVSHHPGLCGGRLLWVPRLDWVIFVAVLFVAAFLSLSQVSEFLYYDF